MQGPKTKEILGSLVEIDLTVLKYYSIATAVLDGQDVFLARTGYTGEDGFEIFVEGDPSGVWQLLLSQDGVSPCGLACRDTLRLEAGMPLYGHELNKDLTPFAANLGKVIRFDKPNFVGKDALEEQNIQSKDSLAFRVMAAGLQEQTTRSSCLVNLIQSG